MSIGLRERATLVALKKMFDPSAYFDICTVDTLRKVWALPIPESEYSTLRLLHCVHWNQMPNGTREEVMQMVTGYIRSALPPAEFEEVFTERPAQKVSLFRRLTSSVRDG